MCGGGKGVSTPVLSIVSAGVSPEMEDEAAHGVPGEEEKEATCV